MRARSLPSLVVICYMYLGHVVCDTTAAKAEGKRIVSLVPIPPTIDPVAEHDKRAHDFVP